MPRRAATLVPLVVLGLAAGSAAAQDPDDVCVVEVGVVCPRIAWWSAAMRTCLDAHRGQVSQACRDAALTRPEPEPPRELREACREDFQRLCPKLGAEASRKRVVACLKDHRDEVSLECSDALAVRKKKKTLDAADCYRVQRAICPNAGLGESLRDCLRFREADLPKECRIPRHRRQKGVIDLR
jgi:hypothetical protein